MNPFALRTGIGYDVHPFVENRPLFLGGVLIPYERGLAGHSDADVLLHAICDSLLGAAGLQDIGYQFPNTDQRFKNADSKLLLKTTLEKITHEGFSIINIDSMLIAEEPKINPYIVNMKETISKIINIESNRIGIKATTNEKMGFTGRKEGIAAFATCLIVQGM
jgi:2-C-methyl-D-erythritol 2,4-cyclodiphosphate synthase